MPSTNSQSTIEMTNTCPHPDFPTPISGNNFMMRNVNIPDNIKNAVSNYGIGDIFSVGYNMSNSGPDNPIATKLDSSYESSSSIKLTKLMSSDFLIREFTNKNSNFSKLITTLATTGGNTTWNNTHGITNNNLNPSIPSQKNQIQTQLTNSKNSSNNAIIYFLQGIYPGQFFPLKLANVNIAGELGIKDGDFQAWMEAAYGGPRTLSNVRAKSTLYNNMKYVFTGDRRGGGVFRGGRDFDTMTDAAPRQYMNTICEVWIQTPVIDPSKLNSRCNNNTIPLSITSYEAAMAFGAPQSKPTNSCLNTNDWPSLLDYSVNKTWQHSNTTEAFTSGKNPLANSVSNSDSTANNISASIDKENKIFNSLQNSLNNSVNITNDAIGKSVQWNIAKHAALSNMKNALAQKEDRYFHRVSNNYHFFAWGAAAIVLVAASLRAAH